MDLRAFLQKGTAGVRRGYDPAKDKSVSASSDEDREEPLWTRARRSKVWPMPCARRLRGWRHAARDRVLRSLMFIPSMVWPTFDKVSDVSDLSAEALYERVQEMEARKLGLDKRPDVRTEDPLQKKHVPLARLPADEAPPEPRPDRRGSACALRTGAGEVRSSGTSPLRSDQCPTLDLAAQAAARFRKGLVPSSIVREIGTPRTRTSWSPPIRRPDGVAFGQHPGIDMALFGMKEGEVSDPIADQGGY